MNVRVKRQNGESATVRAKTGEYDRACVSKENTYRCTCSDCSNAAPPATKSTEQAHPHQRALESAMQHKVPLVCYSLNISMNMHVRSPSAQVAKRMQAAGGQHSEPQNGSSFHRPVNTNNKRTYPHLCQLPANAINRNTTENETAFRSKTVFV